MAFTKRLSKAEQAKQQDIDDLRESLAPGDKVYYILRQYNQNDSGVNRCYAFFSIGADKYDNGRPRPFNLTGRIAAIMKLRWNKAGDGVWCGTHTHANEVVQDLGYILFSDATSLSAQDL